MRGSGNILVLWWLPTVSLFVCGVVLYLLLKARASYCRYDGNISPLLLGGQKRHT